MTSSDIFLLRSKTTLVHLGLPASLLANSRAATPFSFVFPVSSFRLPIAQMKRTQLLRWSNSVLSPGTRTGSRLQHVYAGLRRQSSASPALQTESEQTADDQPAPSPSHRVKRPSPGPKLPSPPVHVARDSAKLAALHGRLYLPSRLPVETLARTLVDSSADRDPNFNNESLATLGHDLLTYYTSEHLLCTYPRLPLAVVFAAMYACTGPKTLSAMAREWGVERAAEPGGEVDPGLLQFKRILPGTDINAERPASTTRPTPDQKAWRVSMSSRVVYDNEFGDKVTESASEVTGITTEQANATFVRAVMGAIYLHAGRPAAKRFFEQHFLSRHLNVSELFNFSQPARDLSRLCAREDFEPPVARIISETGRKSKNPVFLVGIFSGQDKLGEGTGGSLMEARTRAAVAALKGWYLYSPLEVRVPSSTEESNSAPWKPVHVDLGEVIV